ncbi:hypothetical protein D3C72_2486770 [compost metagenome]
MEVVAVKNVVAQYQRGCVVADKAGTDGKCLRQPVRARLHSIRKVEAPLTAITQQLLEAWRVLRCRDDQNVADAGQQ